MKISVIGTGYVGLVVAACLAEMGNQVVGVDVDASKVDQLNNGQVVIHEPGLPELVRANQAAGRLHFTTDFDQAVAHGQVVFIAVATPAGEDGSADLSHVLAVARELGERLSRFTVIVNKSTVPVGTADQVRTVINEALRKRSTHPEFAVVSNPEFLKEGAAVADFMRPDRVVVGTDDERAIDLMKTLYAPFTKNRERFLWMDVRSAEFTKYAANAMLATRISFMNELARVAEKSGVDIEQVRQGMGSDPRIGTSFLYAGCGYGGSCFPKDIRALVHSGQAVGEDMPLLRAVAQVNAQQKVLLVDKVRARFGASLKGRHFALWGLAFKPNTDDLREAPSGDVIRGLLSLGASVTVFDPVAMPAARVLWSGEQALEFADSALAALNGADALIVVTEWRQFRGADLDDIKARLKQPVIFDGRNVFEPRHAQAKGLEHHGMGRAPMGPVVEPPSLQ
ncbi:MAG: UDP-glucose/GDP-mannose dehydrogenase family protein [Pseudomonadota bacterium]